MFCRIMPAHAIGGMQDHVQTLSVGLAQRGHRVVVLTSSRTDGVAFENVRGVEIHYLPNTPSGRNSYAYWRASANKFEKLHRQSPFDILHSQSAGAYGIFARALPRKYRVPLIASFHGTHSDVLTTSWHTDFSLTNPRGTVRFIAIALDLLYRYLRRDLWFTRAMDLLIATSDADAHKYQAHYGYPASRIRTVYNGIDTDLFAPRDASDLRAHLGIGADEKMLLALARLQKDKGVQNAIAVLARVREQFPARLVVVGDGDYRAALERMARDLGVAAHTHFAGAQTLAECARYFNACDVFLDPTLRTDGYDLTIAEAMACAKPVIVSDVGANSTLIDVATQRDGMLIPRGDNDVLARAITGILGDAPRARAMGESARAKIVARFSIAAMVEGMERVYRELTR
ncbi:MAG: glycosyltransferase family 4 protein [Chloroflexi bacterium]|nr:glycosyltransferase family 4 protein [Chloroflexota bacterium]